MTNRMVLVAGHFSDLKPPGTVACTIQVYSIELHKPVKLFTLR